jgi:hypothetical protein
LRRVYWPNGQCYLKCCKPEQSFSIDSVTVSAPGPKQISDGESNIPDEKSTQTSPENQWALRLIIHVGLRNRLRAWDIVPTYSEAIVGGGGAIVTPTWTISELASRVVGCEAIVRPRAFRCDTNVTHPDLGINTA